MAGNTHDYDTTVGVQIEALSDAEIQSLQKLEDKLRSIVTLLKQTTSTINGAITKANNVVTKGTTNSVKTIAKTTETATKNVGTLGIALGKAWKFGKLVYIVNMMKYIGASFARSTINRAIDFTETVNLFSVAMGKATDQALKFQHTINNTVATSMDAMMNAQAKFQTMLTSMAGENTNKQALYGLSETLTKMAMDYSSLYNIAIEDAIVKYQSALAQQVRPIRNTSGYDITQNTLKEMLTKLNIDKPISKLSQMEKRLLIIYALNEQMAQSGAMDDYAKTIESPAQQLKVLSNLLEEIGRYLGGVVYPLLTKILPVVNGIAWAVKELLKTLSYFVGYEPFDAMRESDALGSYLDGANESAEDTIDSIDKLKKKVAGFDELNDITPNSNASDSAFGDMDVSQEIIDALGQYNSTLEEVSMKAEKIKEDVLSWLGFTKQINEETGEILYKFVGWKGIDLTPIQKALATIKPHIDTLFANIQTFFGWFNQNVVQPILKRLVEEYLPIAIQLFGALIGLFNAISTALAPIVEPLWNGIVLPLLQLAGSAILSVLQSLVGLLQDLGTWINENQESFRKFIGLATALFVVFKSSHHIKNFVAIMKNLPSIMSTVSSGIASVTRILGGLIASAKSLFGIITGFIASNPITAILIGLTALFTYLYTTSEEFRSWVNGVFEGILDYLSNLVDKFVQAGVDIIGGFVEGILTFDLTKFFSGLWNGVINLCKGIFGIHSPSTVFDDIGVNIMQGLFNGLQSMYDKVIGWFRGLKEDVAETVEGITTKVSDITNGVKESAGEVINKATTAIQNTASSVSKVGSQIQSNLGNIAVATGNAVKTTWDKVISSASNIANKVKSFLIPQFANGGFPTRGDLFIANEAGPELVANIGGKNMVANQQQLFSSLTEAFREMMGTQNSTPTTINLTVDGKVLASTTVKNINKMVNQLGYNPLAI